MKFVFLSGGFAGFALVAALGFYSGRAPDRILMDSAVGCLVGALLFEAIRTLKPVVAVAGVVAHGPTLTQACDTYVWRVLRPGRD